MRISVITAVYNRVGTVREAIESVQAQRFDGLEHVLIDGASTDGSLEVMRELADARTVLVSEPDEGIYDALSKGFDRATGDAVGLMHSDDLFADDEVLASVAAAFEDPAVDAVYGDLQYVAQDDPTRVIRHWHAGEFSPPRLRRGWMPPHPTLYLRRSVLDRLGSFDTSYRIAADYDAILRYFGSPGFTAAYVPRVLVRMRVGGESNQSLRKILRKSREDYRALRASGVGGLGTLALKNLSKVGQFVRKG